MKKLALVLGTLATVSSVAMAKEVAPAPTVAAEPTVITKEVIREVKVQPDFRVTSINTKLYLENRTNSFFQGKNNGNRTISEEAYFATTANFAYKKDWTGTLQARRYFTSGDEALEIGGTKDQGNYEQGAVRAYVTARRNNIMLGNIKNAMFGTLEFRPNQDFYGIGTSSELTKWTDLGMKYEYRSVSSTNSDDINFFEFTPRLKYAGYTMTYFYEYTSTASDSHKKTRLAQLRLGTPSYKLTDKLSTSFSYRGTLSQDKINDDGTTEFGFRSRTDGLFKINRFISTTTYRLTPSVDLRLEYFFEAGKHHFAGTEVEKKGNRNAVDLGVTWKF